MSLRSPPTGRLVLVPVPLDFGTLPDGHPAPALSDTLPQASIRRAAAITHWVCENAKTARAFLKRVDAVVALAAPLQAQHIVELPRPPKGGGATPLPAAGWAELLAPARAGQALGLMSEAGLPAVADPGHALVAAAHVQGLSVEVLSGPSSLLLALAASGLEGQRFAFVGYVPSEAAARTERLRALEQRSRKEDQAQILIETPYRNQALVAALLSSLAPTTRLSISVGLTLAGGFSRTARIAQWRQQPLELPRDRPAVFVLQA